MTSRSITIPGEAARRCSVGCVRTASELALNSTFSPFIQNYGIEGFRDDSLKWLPSPS